MEQVKGLSCGLFSCCPAQYRQPIIIYKKWMNVFVFFFTAHSETCAEESASLQKWPPSHWSPSGWLPEGHILRGHSSGKNKQQWNASQICRSSLAGLHVSVCTYLQVCAGKCGPSQVAILQFGVFQRGHSQVDSCHLTSFHVYALKVGSYNHTHTLIWVLQQTHPWRLL